MSPPLKQTDRKRIAILQAAIAEFRSKGFEATSMDKIAATAEVSKRTVYNHFPGKEDLFAAILMHLWETASAQNDIVYQKEKPLKAQLQEFLSKKMQLICDPDFLDLVRVAVAATIHTPERARDMVDKLNKREEGIVAWVKAAQADKKLKAGDATFMCDMLQGQLKALAFWPQIAMGQATLTEAQQKKVIQVTTEMFLQYYGKPERI